MQRSWLLVRSVIIGYTNSEEKRACKGIDLECSTEVMYRALLSSSLEQVARLLHTENAFARAMEFIVDIGHSLHG